MEYVILEHNLDNLLLPERKDYREFIYCKEGSCSFICNEAPFTLKKGCCAVIITRFLRNVEVSEDFDCDIIYIDSNFLRRSEPNSSYIIQATLELSMSPIIEPEEKDQELCRLLFYNFGLRIADKKHNILFVGDSGAKFLGDTDAGEAKKDVALTTLGTISYLVNDHGDDYALLTSTDKGYDFSFFRSGKRHLENLLIRYEKCLAEEESKPLNKTLDYIAENLRRKMIIFIITDMEGIASLDENLLKRLTVRNDVMLINVEDAYLTGDSLYDLEAKSYEKRFLLRDKKLHERELADRNARKNAAKNMYKKYCISSVDISREEDVVDKIVELFERHRNENVG